MKKISFALLSSILVARAFGQIEVTVSGDVGVGTSIPVTPLHVKGGATMTAGWNKTATLEANYPVQLFFSGSSKWGGIGYDHGTGMRFWINASSSDLSGTGATILTLNNDNQVRVAGIVGVSSGGANYVIDNAPTLRLGRYNNGSGIAYGYVHAPYNESVMVWNHATAGIAEFKNNLDTIFYGKVGIGTTSPANSLHLIGVGNTGFFLDTAGQNSPYVSFRQEGGEKGYIQYTENGSGVDYLRYEAPAHSFTGGNVGIGTMSPAYKLEVAGTVRASNFISNTTSYADFVFKPDYQLPTLSEVEAHINERGHLPGIPSETEARANGIDLARMQVQLLQKIEELTLHLIAQEKQLKSHQGEIRLLRAQTPVSDSP
jgi:hypothetical protein